MSYVRMQISLTTRSAILSFLTKITSSDDKFILEDFGGEFRTPATSILGVVNLAISCKGEVYLCNMSHDGQFPGWLDDFRALTDNV